MDAEKGIVYFTACGREPDRNPYFEHLYRVNLDGSDLVLLTPEASHHAIIPPGFYTSDYQLMPNVHGLSPNGKVFIDTLSRVDQPSTTLLRSCTDGAPLMTLSQCPPDCLDDTPYTYPMPFTVKASDDSTDLWGVIYKPSDFDASQHYPVILGLYGAPQTTVSPKAFAEFNGYLSQGVRGLTEMGFIVVTVDPRGTPLRSKAFQEESLANFQNGGGIDDQVAALKQLAARYPWMDLTRVGITGTSGGGFASARAMLTHADFFKVAVANAGSHDYRVYNAIWAESYQGLLNGDNFNAQASINYVQHLKGKLLLVHGDMDANVHIAHTLQLVDQLIKHNKDFDLLIMPNRQHAYATDPYFIRRLWDYFVEHLLKETPPANYCIGANNTSAPAKRTLS